MYCAQLHNGSVVVRATPNIVGGIHAFNSTGHFACHTQPNILGGMNIYDSTNARVDTVLYRMQWVFMQSF